MSCARTSYRLLLLLLLFAACEDRDGGGAAASAGTGELLMDSPFTPQSKRRLDEKLPTSSYELAQAEDYSLQVHRMTRCEVAEPFAARAGTFKLGVEVELRGTGTRQVPVNAFNAKLSDENGKHYRATLAGCRPALEVGSVTLGQSKRGFITFEVSEKASEFLLSYAPFVVGTRSQELQIKLDRWLEDER